jgi:hypothetical protein
MHDANNNNPEVRWDIVVKIFDDDLLQSGSLHSPQPNTLK